MACGQLDESHIQWWLKNLGDETETFVWCRSKDTYKGARKKKT